MTTLPFTEPALIRAELLRKEPIILGTLFDGTDFHLRFRAALAALWVRVHIQSYAAGEGGPTYDPVDFTSSTLVDCRADRVQDVVIADGAWFVWLIPEQKDAAGTFVLFDGEGGRPDAMSFIGLG